MTDATVGVGGSEFEPSRVKLTRKRRLAVATASRITMKTKLVVRGDCPPSSGVPAKPPWKKG